MAPVNKLKTYGRSNRSLVNNSVDAGRILFHKTKSRVKKKKRLAIKELPVRLNNADTLLIDDSLQVSIEDTFDKLLKGNVCNPVNIRSHISIVNSDSSASIKTVDSFYSPIMTRRRKRAAIITETFDSSDDTNRNNHITPYFKEPSVEKIDNSLEIETVKKPVINSLSYITIPTLKENEISINVLPNNTSKNNTDISFDPFLLRTFNENHLIHSSTPVVSLKTRAIINHTVSPITVGTKINSFTDKKLDFVISTPLKPVYSGNIESHHDSRKLKMTCDIGLSICPEKDSVETCKGFESIEKKYSEVVHRQLQNVIDNSENLNLRQETENNFITLRKRKVFKTNNKLRQIKGKLRNLRTSFEKGSYITNNTDIMESSSHYESFRVYHKEILSPNCDNSKRGLSFVSNRRRRLTDSYLIPNKKLKTSKNINNCSRRLSLQENSFVDCPVNLPNVVVLLPKINMASKDIPENSINDITNIYSVESNDLSSSYNLTNNSETDLETPNDSLVVDNDYFKLKHPILKDLAVDITKMALSVPLCTTNSYKESIREESRSLFESLSIGVNNENSENLDVDEICQAMPNDSKSLKAKFCNVVNQKEILNVVKKSLAKRDSSKESDNFPNRKSNLQQCSISNKGVNSNNSFTERESEMFEKPIDNITQRSHSIKSLRSSKSSSSLQNNFVIDDFNKKELIVNLTRHKWHIGSGQSESCTNNTIIDLIDSFEEIRNADSNGDLQVAKDSEYCKHSISDIIECSSLDSTQEDDVFKVPAANNSRKRHSKTLVLKAGKLWRRSFSMYKRSSLLLADPNKDVCQLPNGDFSVSSKCNLVRQSMRMSNKRLSIRIVPAKQFNNTQREISILENYAQNTSYVSDRILQGNLENDFRSLSLSKNYTFINKSAPIPLTARDLVLKRCGQDEPLPFEECYPKSVLQNCQKIGEGVYGEVFLFRNPKGGTSVMKIIPIEGDLIVNGERQKKFEEILSEITIALELSNLRNNQNKTYGFSEVQRVCCVQGRYPAKLLDLWDLYDETRDSENDSPEIFTEDQLYIVLQLANGGTDLEAYVFNNSLQAYTMFQQVACALAVAEEELCFEHRDLHWGNILISTVDKSAKVSFSLNGKNYEIMTKGVEVAIIDFTLSRMECEGVVIFNDLSLDPELFTAEGDYQFEIYKLMQKKNGNNWQRFEPYSNILWLHYVLDKCVNALRYKNTHSKTHKEYLTKLRILKDDILDYNSVKEFVSVNF